MKERLTGAIILVALIVLLVPELLTGPVRSGSTSQAIASSAEEPPLRSYTIDLADDPRTHAAAGTTTPQQSGSESPAAVDPNANAANPGSITEGPAGAGAGEQAQPTSPSPIAAASPSPASGPTPEPVSRATTSPLPASKPPAPAPSAPRVASTAAKSSGVGSGSAWMVQLGVFANRANADRLAQELKGKGFRVGVSEASAGGRKLFRVRAGPVPDRTTATDLAARLRAAGATASVVPRT